MAEGCDSYDSDSDSCLSVSLRRSASVPTLTQTEEVHQGPKHLYLDEIEKQVQGKRDPLAPTKKSIDIPTIDFIRFSTKAARRPFPIDGMLAIVEDSGVKKHVHQKGISSDKLGKVEEVTEGCRVWFHYEMYAVEEDEDDLQLKDSTLRHGIASSLKIGSEGIVGLQLALQSMTKNEISEFAIEPEYGYGKLGILSLIGGDTRLRFIIQLMDIWKPFHQSIEFLSDSENKQFKEESSLEDLLLNAGNMQRAGDENFEKGLFDQAATHYNLAIFMMDDYLVNQEVNDDGTGGESKAFYLEEDREIVEKKSYVLYSKMSLAYLYLEDYEETKRSCELAMGLTYPDHDEIPKVLSRLGWALLNTGKLEEALKIAKRGLGFTSDYQEFRDLETIVRNTMLEDEEEARNAEKNDNKNKRKGDGHKRKNDDNDFVVSEGSRQV